MNSYHILKDIHRVGHPITCIVLKHEKSEDKYFVFCKIEVKTNSKFKSVINFFCPKHKFSEEMIPEIGSMVEAVIENHVDDILYLSIDPKKLQKIQEYQNFYQFIETIDLGTIKTGIVSKIMPFGVFVDLSCPYWGLIDIGHISFNGGKQLTHNFNDEIEEGDKIRCVVSYFRLYDMQIGLGWLPE